MGKNKNETKIGILVVLLILAVGFIAWGEISPADEALTVFSVADGVSVPIECSSETTPDKTLKGVDENAGTVITEATNLYRLTGEKVWGTFTLGTAMTNLIVGGTYEYVVGITTTDMTDNAYGSVGTFTVQCKEADSEEIDMSADEIEGSVTATFYNKNHDASASTIGANTNQLIYAEFYTGADEVFGNPYIAESGISMSGRNANYPNMIQLKLNSTDTDKPLSVKVDGVDMKGIGCGTIVTSTTGFINYCYEAPVVTDTPMEFVINIDADDTVAIATDGTANLHASNFYIDEDDYNTVKWGNEDEDGNFLGTDAVVALTLDFTA